MTTKRAAIYGRVSTDDQRSNYSIPTQIAACCDYARDRYSIVGDHFVDATTGQDAQSDAPGAVRAYVDDYSSRESHALPWTRRYRLPSGSGLTC